MPTNTFYNLPKDKKNKVFKAALTEFSNHPYHVASINQIVKQAGISKGSIYKYFENKMDLYRFLFICIAEEKQKAMPDMNDDVEFFVRLKNLYIYGLEFGIQNPEMTRLAERFLQENKELQNEIMKDYNNETKDIFTQFIEVAQQKGEIISDIDSKFLTVMFLQLNQKLSEIIFEDMEIEELSNRKHEYLNKVNQMLRILQYGVVPERGKK